MLSRISSLHFEYYSSVDILKEVLNKEMDEIQCIATKMDIPDIKTVDLGQTQSPGLIDYADSVDTMEFLLNLS